MSASEDKIKDFVIARSGEIEGLESVLKHLSERSQDFQNNTVRVQSSSKSILSTLDRLNVALDTQLLRVDTSSPETLVQQLLDVLVEVRRAIRLEEQTAVREFGFVYGALNTNNEIVNTLNEKIESARASVNNQKELLQRAEVGDPSRRPTGTRPIPLKDERKFDEIVNTGETSK